MLIALITVPLFGGFAVLLLGFSEKYKRLAPIVTLLLLLLTLIDAIPMASGLAKEGPTIYSMGGFPSPIGIELRLDGPALLGSVIGLIIILLATCYAISQGIYGALFYGIVLLLTASMQAVLLSNDIFNLYVYLEVLSVCTYFLIAYQQRSRALKATLDYLFVSSLAFALYIVGVALIYKTTGVLGFGNLSQVLERIGDNETIRFAMALLLTGIGMKTAFFPLHTWLPDAHAQAPAPVSAILSGVMIKVSFLCMWRIVMVMHRVNYFEVLLWVGLASAFIGALLAVIQVDIKRLLACSSVSQMGFIIASFGSTNPWGEVGSLNVWGEIGSLFHVVNHAVFKSLLFLCAGIIIARTGTRDLRRLTGLRSKMPLVSVCLIVGACAISGVPGFNGFVSKSWIFYAVDRMPIPYWALAMTSVLTVTAMCKLLGILWGPHETGGEAASVQALKPSILFAPIVLALSCLLIGLFPEGVEDLIRNLLDIPMRVRPLDGIYTGENFAKSFALIALGTGVYFLIRTDRGKEFTARLRRLQLTLNGKLLLVVAAAIGFYLLSMK